MDIVILLFFYKRWNLFWPNVLKITWKKNWMILTLKSNNVLNSFARIESLCLFNFGWSLRIKSISKLKQSSLLWHFFKILKLLPIVSGSFPCSSLTWLLIAHVPPHVDVGVDSWSRHSLHRTDHTCNNKQRFVDSQLEVYVSLVSIFLWSFDLCKQAGQRHQSFDWDHLVGDQPKLNKQSDSIRAKLFTYFIFHFFFKSFLSP